MIQDETLFLLTATKIITIYFALPTQFGIIFIHRKSHPFKPKKTISMYPSTLKQNTPPHSSIINRIHPFVFLARFHSLQRHEIGYKIL